MGPKQRLSSEITYHYEIPHFGRLCHKGSNSGTAGEKHNFLVLLPVQKFVHHLRTKSWRALTVAFMQLQNKLWQQNPFIIDVLLFIKREFFGHKLVQQ